ncbi:hypothetical protein GGTG_11267 [Gaeumannomyces tritici R3-111a-1]|uniref:Ubiquitin-like domain-containing protein n=1 Tax=Gaeumannomyces tritici (strain R3-111a-1) TaxID=644352 RepID=J3PCP9_GAET3|nr:hypothetical protein GGTG_11267 [Gaeumannomyces tritici R3-111a-1]EJT72019.1 hypothetical protein GGTG_11267 [Gaeumannomyces tritici R3-111a-1]
MAEVAFASTFLSQLDSRPAKLSPDHVEDPRNYPARSAYIMPRMPKPMSKRARPSNPGQERSVTVHLRSLRNPPLDIKLTSQPLGTSVLDVRTAAAAQAGLRADKVKLLHKKKPVADSKVLRDLVAADDETLVEFSVMVLGGAAAAIPKAEEDAAAADQASPAAAPTAQGVSGAEAVQSEEFWVDLRGFLLQRVRDETYVDELSSTFRKAWEDRS